MRGVAVHPRGQRKPVVSVGRPWEEMPDAHALAGTWPWH